MTTCSNRQVAPKTVATVPAFLQSLKKMVRHVAYELILGASQFDYLFSLPAQNELFFFMNHNKFYLNVLLPHLFTWTFMLVCLRGQPLGQCQY